MDCTCFRYIISNIDYRDPGKRTEVAREFLHVYRRQGEDDFNIFMRLSNLHLEAGIDADCPLTKVLTIDGTEAEIMGPEDFNILENWGDVRPCDYFYKYAYTHPKNHCCLLCSLSERYANVYFKQERAVICNLLYGRFSVSAIRKIRTHSKGLFTALVNAFEGDTSHLDPLVIRGFEILAGILLSLDEDKAETIIGVNSDSDSIINLLIPYMSSAINKNCGGALKGVAFERSSCKLLLYKLVGSDFIKDAADMPVSASLKFIESRISDISNQKNPDAVKPGGANKVNKKVKGNTSINKAGIKQQKGNSSKPISDDSKYKAFDKDAVGASDGVPTGLFSEEETSNNIPVDYSEAFAENELTEDEIYAPFGDGQGSDDIARDDNTENGDDVEPVYEQENSDTDHYGADGSHKSASLEETVQEGQVIDRFGSPLTRNMPGNNISSAINPEQWDSYPVISRTQLSSAVKFVGKDITLKVRNIFSNQKVFYVECYFDETGNPIFIFYVDKIKKFYYTPFDLKASRGYLSFALSEPSVQIVTYHPWLLYNICRKWQLKITNVFSVYDYLVHVGMDRVNLDIMKYRREHPIGVIRRYRSYFEGYLADDKIDKTDAGYLARRRSFNMIIGYNYLPLYVDGLAPIIKIHNGKVALRKKMIDYEDYTYSHDGAIMSFSITKPSDRCSDIIHAFLNRCSKKNIWVAEPGIRLLCIGDESLQFFVTDTAYKDFYDYAVILFLDVGDSMGIDVQVSVMLKAVGE